VPRVSQYTPDFISYGEVSINRFWTCDVMGDRTVKRLKGGVDME
jgi:hypothetical protein